jgi:hypothetical protein
LQYFKCNLVDINRPSFLIVSSKQGKYTVEYFAGATAVLYYPVQICRRFVDIGWHPCKKSPCCTSVNRDGHQGLRRCIGEAMTAVETTKETWFEAEVHRIAGEIALRSSERDAAKAQNYFERALEVARRQQAKSWELPLSSI